MAYSCRKLGSRSVARPAFTLVELLVVIGIIAVLIGILLPSLSRARASAQQVKCAASLQQIGLGFQMYANEFNGACPPAKLNVTDSTYTIGDDAFAKGANIMWYNFIAPEVNAANMGVANSSSTAGTVSSGYQASQSRKRNVLWGCPTFEGYSRYASRAGDDVNETHTGYGMNAYPKFGDDQAYDPTGAVGGSENNGGSKAPDVNQISMTGGAVKSGNWFKMNAYTRAADKGLVADCSVWFYESLSVQTKTPLPNVARQSAAAPSVIWGSDPGETTVALFRHGSNPNTVGSGTGTMYDSSGGKIAYNILYCDGHVSESSTAAEAYRAQRQRFPDVQ